MDGEEQVKDALNGLKVDGSPSLSPAVKKSDHSSDSTPIDSKRSVSRGSSPREQKLSRESASTPNGNHAPKISRKSSSRTVPRQTTLFDQLPDMTTESLEHFQVIPDCLYGSRSLGSTEHDAFDCDCNEEWRDGMNHACGEDSDCINRATKMECVDRECNCGDGCQNQRFQRREYANVSVIKTDKKGFGLRANQDLEANDFIYEYIGEVINEPTFRRRMAQYDKEGIKHFYFMSLNKSEFVDATKKGNLGRFCNHSCNPNCYVDKWVVGNKLRMGIFAGRHVQAGEELVFNYNVDRYGADPQPCYCGEPNCEGYIGGKTQTGDASQPTLSVATREALGITADKGARRKKIDEEYVQTVEMRALDEEGVTKVMAALMQCKEKWLAIKLLERIQTCEDDRVRNRVVQMHGYQILKTTLNTFGDDDNVVLQILDILHRFPRLTRNKISDSNIESAIQPLTQSPHLDVSEKAARLLGDWSKLEVAYRIPRKKLDPNGGASNANQTPNSFDDRRGNRAPEEPQHKVDVTLPDNVPKGPRSSIPQRNANFNANFNPNPNFPRPRRPAHFGLPVGWFTAQDARGQTYYYTKTGKTTWQKPTMPCVEPVQAQPAGPSKAKQDQQTLQDIIDSLTKPENIQRRSATQTPQQVGTPIAPEPKNEKWRSLPIDKQMKLYENTLFPHVKHVMDKFRHKLPKDELKKFAKDISKKTVASDYKHNRVDDPTSISEKQERKVKLHVKQYFDRAVEKHRENEKRKAERVQKDPQTGPSTNGTDGTVSNLSSAIMGKEDVAMTDDEDTESSPGGSDRKRKRNEEAAHAPVATPSVKRLKEEGDAPSPPPPPPPPPELQNGIDGEMAEQEAALMRENEEAERQELREQEAAMKRETKLDMFNAHGEASLGEKGDKDDKNGLSHGDIRKQEVMSH